MNVDNTTNKIKVDWQHFYDIPIEEVANILGIELMKNKMFLCPSHADTKPSAQLRIKTNRWCCYTCGDGKSQNVIGLVMAYENCSALDAALFLNQYFPGGVSAVEEEKEDKFQPPLIPDNYIKEIGLKVNPFKTINIRSIVNINDDKRPVKEQRKFKLSYEDAADVILDKLQDYKKQWMNYITKIQTDFPELTEETKIYLREVADSHCNKAQGYIETLRDYKNEINKLEPDKESPWLDENQTLAEDVKPFLEEECI